ncbi:hypothetical protein [Demequina salsinemoris]|uniref:hypothetical protein n=1 Tax=Demequina salsinemoris TaxID=577470 RepID=UPI000780CBC4|nr:hypothetical protein [Demequina salsinemoris]
MRVSARRRLTRALAGAAVTTFAALGSHVLAGAHTPTLVGVAMPFALAFVVCFHLVGTRLTLPRLTAAVIASQGIFHLLFAWGTASATLSGDTSAHHVEPGSLAVHASHAGHSGTGMTIAHLMAAVATIAAIHRADRLWAALRGLATHLARRWREALTAPAPLPAPATRIVPAVRRPVAARRAVVSQPALLRGPPAFSL